VNVAMPRSVTYGDRTFNTGILKMPVTGRVRLGRLNLEGDGQADLKNHGGPDRALHLYPAEHYDYWRTTLRMPELAPGAFGENLTAGGVTEQTVHVGDVFRVGTAVVQITQPRIPCYKLDLRFGRADLQKLYLTSGRIGYHLRVLEEGDIGAGDAIERTRVDPAGITVAEMSEILHVRTNDLAAARRALTVEALAPVWRSWFIERINGTD
jgi:MOSC domain-containing protein YiiM